MGRWGDGTYESDSSLDFLASTVSATLVRELLALISPEVIQHNKAWLHEVLTIIEIMLLFDTRHLDYELLVHIDILPQTLKRCEETFFDVWDADWDENDETEVFNNAYRVDNRYIVEAWFERVILISTYYHDFDQEFDLPVFIPPKPLPYFSALEILFQRLSYFWLGTIFYRLIEELTQIIAKHLSSEFKQDAIDRFYHIEEVNVCVDVIGFLCKRYKKSPKLKPEVIDSWEKQYTAIYTERLHYDPSEDETYKNELKAFAHLKEQAKKYPPPRWG